MGSDGPKLTFLGRFISFLLVVGLIGLGVYVLRQRGLTPKGLSKVFSSGTGSATDEEIAEPLAGAPPLPSPIPYQMSDSTIDIELSEYAGYAGLIMANKGLEPNDQSFFYRKYGFKVRIRFSEEEAWPRLNGGQLAASGTTVDVLPVYGRQLYAVVPALIGFSRGADGIIVRSTIKRINALKGKRVAVSQFNEADFFLRYLAQEAGIGLHVLPSPESANDPERVNILYCVDAFAAGDYFLRDIEKGGETVHGCVTWAPKTTEVVAASQGKAHMLTSNKNLLIVADILAFNKGFAEKNPRIVGAVVEGMLDAHRQIRANPECCVDLLSSVYKWTPAQTRDELAKVHLANLPENIAFFSGAIDAAGSFSGIYQSAVLAYGTDYIKDPVDAERFADLTYLTALEKSGVFAGDKIQISPIKTGGSRLIEGDPLLSKDIRFYFLPNSADLDLSSQENLKNLENVKRLLQVSPGSTILLRGHVDNKLVDEFRSQGGEAFLRQMALKAMDLSKKRAVEVRRRVAEKYLADSTRIETVGRGWEEPVSGDSDLNRRVEVQWFTVE